MQQSFKLGGTNYHFKWVNPGTVPYCLKYPPMQLSLKLGATMHHFKWVKPGTVHYFLEYPMQQSLKLGTPNHHFKWVKLPVAVPYWKAYDVRKRGGSVCNRDN